MPPLIAEAIPNANTVWIVIVALASVGANVATIIMVFAGRAKQKREVSFEFEPASKNEFEKHVEWNRREHENLFSKIGGVERGGGAKMEAISKEWRGFVDDKFVEFQDAQERGREKIHARINRISVGVARLCGRMNVPMPEEDAEI